jgi:transposase-like protein
VIVEKKAVIDEVFSHGRVYLDENIDIIIETVRETSEAPENCPHCHHELTELYSRPVEFLENCDDYDLIVLKCQNCSRVTAFYVEPFTWADSLLTPRNDDEYVRGRVVKPHRWKYVGKPEWGEGEKPLIPKRCSEAYKKAISQSKSPHSKLDRLIQAKLRQMYQEGLNIETINFARNKVMKQLKNSSPTCKQLTTLFAAEIYNSAQDQISERRLEKIFGISRKTIRKWSKISSTEH